jgi:hypothetical protein
VVESLDCQIRPKEIKINVRTGKDAEIELWQAQERADLFEKLFGRKVEIRLVKKKKK